MEHRFYIFFFFLHLPERHIAVLAIGAQIKVKYTFCIWNIIYYFRYHFHTIDHHGIVNRNLVNIDVGGVVSKHT